MSMVDFETFEDRAKKLPPSPDVLDVLQLLKGWTEDVEDVLVSLTSHKTYVIDDRDAILVDYDTSTPDVT